MVRLKGYITKFDGRVLAGHLAMLCFSLVVSVSFSLGSLVANQIEPLVITAARFVLASAFIGIIFFFYKKSSLKDLKSPLRFFALGAVISVYFITMFEGLKTANPISMSVIFTLTPLIAGLCDYVISGRKLSLFVWVSVIIGGFGALWVIFDSQLYRLVKLDLGYGESVFFLGCVGHAVYAALIPKLNRGESPLSQTFGTLLAASIILSVIGYEKIFSADWGAMPALVWVAICYLAIFATAASFFLIQFAAIRLSSLKVMAYTYAIPFWVTGFELILGQSSFTSTLIIGGIAIFYSLVFLLVNREF